MFREIAKNPAAVRRVLKGFATAVSNGEVRLSPRTVNSPALSAPNQEHTPTLVTLPTTSYRKTPRLENRQEPSGDIAQMIDDENTYRNQFMPDRIRSDALISLGLTKFRSSV